MSSNHIDDATMERNTSEVASMVEATILVHHPTSSSSSFPHQRRDNNGSDDDGEESLLSMDLSSQILNDGGARTVSTANTSDIGQPDTTTDFSSAPGLGASLNDDTSSFKSSPSSLRHRPDMNSKKSSEWRLVQKRSSSISKSASSSEMLSEMTINKLKIKNIEIVGREKEIGLLQERLDLLMSMAGGQNKNEDKDVTGSSAGNDYNQQQHQPSLLVHSQTPKQLIFIKGYSGVGKSSLAKGLEDITMGNNCAFSKKDRKDLPTIPLFVQAKFDLNSSNGPYLGVARLFGQIVLKLMAMTTTTNTGESPSSKQQNAHSLTVDNAQQSLQKLLGEKELELLTQLVPELQDIVDTSNSNSSSSNEEQSSAIFNCNSTITPEKGNVEDLYAVEYGQERMKYAFQILTRILTSFFSPTILVFDDLQFADVASLEVIDNIVSDQQNPNPLMIIGCYRSNEVDENSILYNRIQSLNEKQETAGFNMTEIEVKACELEDVNKMILSMLGIDDPGRTLGLAKITFKRTLGNPFFVIQFVKMLVDEGLITFNLGLLKWTWDDDKIDAATMSTDNVVELLKMKLRKLPPKVQLFLQHAACLGSVFRLSTLDLVWRKCNAIHLAANQQVDDEHDNVQGMIDLAVEESILEKHDTSQQKYRWVHDQIQGAAMTLSTTFDESFEFSIGTAMLYTMEENDLEEHLFEVADLINKGKAAESLDFAQLNLRAAEKAKTLSAFQSASKFAANGIQRLPNDKWQSNRSLTLRLYTLAAELQYALCQFEAAEMYSNEVFSNGNCSPLEEYPLRVAYASKLCSVDTDFRKAQGVCLDLLKQFDCQLYWNRSTIPIHAVAFLFLTIQKTKKKVGRPENIHTLGIMSNSKHRATLSLLTRVGYASAQGEDLFVNLLSICQSIQLTLKYGICDLSGPAFANLAAAVVVIQKDYKTATCFAEIAHAIYEVPAVGTNYLGETMTRTHFFTLPWTCPLHKCLQGYSVAYDESMKIGNIEDATWSLLSQHVWFPYVMGKALAPIEEQCHIVHAYLESVSMTDQTVMLKTLWQMIFNLMTPPMENPTDLEGGIFSAKAYTGESSLQRGNMYLAESELCFFADFESASNRALSHGASKKFEKLCPGTFLNMIETFHRAVALFTMASRSRKHKVQALQLAKIVEKWINAGNPNVKHYSLLLRAEQEALNGNKWAPRNCDTGALNNDKPDTAVELYQSAIATAARTGHLHHAALCNERYANYLRYHHKEKSSTSIKEEAKFRYEEAIRFYQEWGASGKVQQLKNLVE